MTRTATVIWCRPRKDRPAGSRQEGSRTRPAPPRRRRGRPPGAPPPPLRPAARVDQRGHLHHAGGRRRQLEREPVGLADLFPAGDVGDVEPGLHDVGQAGAELRERSAHVQQRLLGLPGDVALVDDLAVHNRGAPADEDEFARRHRPAVADGLLERHARRHPPPRRAASATAASACFQGERAGVQGLADDRALDPDAVSVASARRSSRRGDAAARDDRGRRCPSRRRGTGPGWGRLSMPSLSTSVITYLAQPSASRRPSAS